MMYNEIFLCKPTVSPPFIIVGDFNAHHSLLSSNCLRPDVAGRSVEDLIINTSAVLLNDTDFYTYIDRRSGARGCLDLVFVSADIAPLFELKLLQDVGSDHFPLCAAASLPLLWMQDAKVPRWKIGSRSLTSFAGAVTPSKLICPTSVDELSRDVSQ